MEKMASDGPKQGREDFVPTNPDLASIFGRMDLDFEIFCFLFFGSQISGFPGPQISKIWPGPGRAWALGRAWADCAGPGLGPRNPCCNWLLSMLAMHR